MGNNYTIKEIFYTLQGEGYHAGTPAVFVRFAGCNLWSGDETKREHWFNHMHSPCAKFCDTDFRNGTSMTAGAIVDEIKRLSGPCRQVVFTGGEPSLQFDMELRDAVREAGYRMNMETNGTNTLMCQPDWVTLSPKIEPIKVQLVDEIKVVYPAVDPLQFEALLKDRHFSKASIFCRFLIEPGRKFIQPEDGPDALNNLQASIEFVLAHPDWRLSLQTHKMVGLR
jgi:organic radical activating enzyme